MNDNLAERATLTPIKVGRIIDMIDNSEIILENPNQYKPVITAEDMTIFINTLKCGEGLIDAVPIYFTLEDGKYHIFDGLKRITMLYEMSKEDKEHLKDTNILIHIIEGKLEF